MRMSAWIRQHIAALRALLVLTVITGIIYPAVVLGVAQLPGLKDKANGSLITKDGKLVGSSLIGQAFTDGKGNALVQYFQTRPSNSSPAADSTTGVSAIPDGYDPTNTSFGNMGPESVVDTLDANDPKKDKFSLLTTVCQRSQAVGQLEGVDGSRPYCTSGGVGAVLAVMGERDSHGLVTHPSQVVSVNEACSTDAKNPTTPFLDAYEGVKVECAKRGEDYSTGQIVPIRGDASADTPVPTDAVTASGSGLDPQISPEYAAIQVARVAKARNVSVDQIKAVVDAHKIGRALGFMGEPTVNVVELNYDLDTKYPVKA
ncbi:potassium-transporting ATPase subunit C [Nocardia yunnanensis]|uniref:Potassium-transporting ATPase KdpC subunit n=1 Tax=Nocardia yunnanensis TaxID=2382165 RepID=A0A386ZC12_9NOCA|nr:potassium-transporting ATPase subunit C [Nocardia yunnanensis]AYF75201.1 potassium-transporting ATPase subunit C [Nocardia yunnanensis]